MSYLNREKSMIVYNDEIKGDSPDESRIFSNCDRIQVDFGSSGATSVSIFHRLDLESEWIKVIPDVPVTQPSEMYIIPPTRYQKIVFIGADNSQLAWADRTSSNAK